MIKVLYIASRQINARSVQNIVGSSMKIEAVEAGDFSKVGENGLVIYDWDSNPKMGMNDISMIRSMCGFKDIPIIISANENEVAEADRSRMLGANAIITKPYNSDKVLKTIKQVMTPIGQKTEINTDIVNPFLSATVDVFNKMTGCEATKKDVFLKKSYSLFADISGVMGLSGDTEGTVAVTFQKKLGYELVAKMVGCSEDDLSMEDVHDGIGEMINMISGAAKASLSSTQYKFAISIPTVIMGFGHQVTHPKGVPVIVLVFEINEQPFAVQVCVSSKGMQQPKAESQKKSKAEPQAVGV